MCSSATASRWCCRARSTALTTVPNQFNATQLEISAPSASSGNTSAATSPRGILGGLLAARAAVINPAAESIGSDRHGLEPDRQFAAGGQGLDLNGNFGAADFLGGHAAGHRPPRENTDAMTAAVSRDRNGVGALTANNYVLSYRRRRAYSLTNASDGSNVTADRRRARLAIRYTADGHLHRPVGRRRPRRPISGSAHRHRGRQRSRSC